MSTLLYSYGDLFTAVPGKSLYIKRLHEKLKAKLHNDKVPLKTIRLIDPHVVEGKVLKSLLPFLNHQHQNQPMIFHFDITSSVKYGIQEFLFKLLVLHYLGDTDGRLWQRNQCHLYVIEILEASPSPEKQARSITTFSRLLTTTDTKTLEAELQNSIESIKVLSLPQFDTEHSFLKEIRNFLDASPGNKILIIQTDFENGSLGAQFVASAKYSAVNEINETGLNKSSVFMFFITKLSRVEGGSSYVGFHGGKTTRVEGCRMLIFLLSVPSEPL